MDEPAPLEHYPELFHVQDFPEPEIAVAEPDNGLATFSDLEVVWDEGYNTDDLQSFSDEPSAPGEEQYMVPEPVERIPSTVGISGSSRKRTRTPRIMGDADESRYKPSTVAKKDVAESELTVWELVLKNKRVVSKGEREAAKKARLESTVAKENENRLRSEIGDAPVAEADALMNLFGSGSADVTQATQPAATPDLFAEPVATTSSLEFDADGNIVFSNNSQESSSADALGLDFISGEGKQIITESWGSGTITPYANAYKYTKPCLWSEQDTATFYSALEQCGADMMMVKTFFTKFSDKQIAAKYKLELKRNSERVQRALHRKRQFSLEDYEKSHGRIDRTVRERATELSCDDEIPTANLNEIFGF